METSKVNTSGFISHSEEETRRFAADFARTVRGDEKICLIGPFGAGKTTFVKGFVRVFGIDEHEVNSPTFTLVREYGVDRKIYHVDLYRLDKEEEIFEAGIFELISSDDLVLIEWADHLVKYFPPRCIVLRFSHVNETERRIEIQPI